ncbi:MAG: TCP-1/cpn60 chaperonin family protein [Bacillota bacterium]|nr:TCP-1/cpn60 chaperonin family protein [Bacillota bacterium]
MNYANVKFGNECRDKLIEGVNLVADAVACTYGPNGRNVIIRTPGGVKITKDGYNVASMVNDQDPYIMMGVEIIQDICKKTAKDVGDGTSTSAILARAIVNKYKDCEDPIQVTRDLSTFTDKVISYLEEYKLNVKSKEDLVKVAALSANNDQTIGNLIADAFDKVGKDGIVTFEESEDVKDRVEYTEGFRIDNGFSSPYFINTSKGTCELENVLVYISETKMEELNDVVKLADRAVKEKRSLLLLAPEFDSEILVFLSSNTNLLKSCTVISPNHRNFREIMLKDMRALLGTSSVCKRVSITKDHTTFMGCDSDQEEVAKRVEEIRNTLRDSRLGDIELEFYKKRLANFTSGIATIYVGGYSKVEAKERYDRIEDAVCATQAALDGGILPGGGVMLREVAEALFKQDPSFYEVLKTPSNLLHTEKNSPKEMFDNGVIEPFLVTKTVLQNAVSTASLILTADAAVLNMITF